ncbi:hypothetical protein TSUD_231440 [Trifolium subterraneum]|nr:hypothetical protein TSUD_231440 [Trifolium subterraneum]
MERTNDSNHDARFSYVSLPDGLHKDETLVESRGKWKAGLVIFCGLLVLVSLVTFNGYKGSNGNVTTLNANEDLKQQKIPSYNWKPVSRGVSAGVSEKSNRLFTKTNSNAGLRFPWRFPWNNTMLSWQRTAFHFQPEENWMNGPLYYKGWYHFFYQYNPNAAYWGDIVWAHAASRDLIHWIHLPLAMVADEWYDQNGVWTGSATILPNGDIVMLYTGATDALVQVQNLAYPADPSDPLLIDWIKYPKNPVLVPPPEIEVYDFRDPTTAWLTSQGKWRISIGSKINKTGIAFVYDTVDFKTFERIDGILRAVPKTGMWECVDFFPVSTNLDIGLDTSARGEDVKYVMKVSLDDDRHDYYALGTYDENGADFIPDDTKNDVGTGLSKERRVLWSWIGESDSEDADVAKGWASLMGIPRTVMLDKKTGSNLLQWPIEEVERLRMKSYKFHNEKVMPGSVVSLDIGTEASQLDIEAEFDIDKNAIEKINQTNVEYNCETSGGAANRGALGPFGLLVLADDGLSEYTPVYFYVVKGSNGNLKTSFCSDQTRSSLATDVDKSIFGSSVPVLEGEKLSLRILFL